MDDRLDTVICGDCLDVMPTLPDGCADLILADLPYGTTRNRWDSVIDLEALWTQYRRLIKPAGAIVLTAQTPFDKVLGASNLAWLRYEWIWTKAQGTGHLNAKRAPLKAHENVLVFYERSPLYNPQFTAGTPYAFRRSTHSSNYGQQVEHDAVNDGVRYPTSVLHYPADREKVHPTQKPVALFAYLIRTYTAPGAVVLDNVIGSGTTAVAALSEGRRFVGIERDPAYVALARTRIAAAQDDVTARSAS